MSEWSRKILGREILGREILGRKILRRKKNSSSQNSWTVFCTFVLFPAALCGGPYHCRPAYTHQGAFAVCVTRRDAFFVVDDAFTHLTDGLTIMLGVAVFGRFLKGSSLVSSAQVFCAPAYFMNELKVINDEEGAGMGRKITCCSRLLVESIEKKTKTILLTNRSEAIWTYNVKV